MTRLLIHVEGETEESFVNDLLAPHLCTFGYQKVGARLLGNARDRARRGGIRSWASVRKDIVNHLKEDAECLATTMIDYYALPSSGARAWPGRNEASTLKFAEKALTVQSALHQDIRGELGSDFNPKRFLPYVMMHEFEGLLFSDPVAFANGIGRSELADQFELIRRQFGSPEEINDSPQTAPSKRIRDLVPGYEKPLLGVLAAIEIGLQKIRAECPLFQSWLENLESWPAK